MHGRKKSTTPPSQKEVEAIKKKIATYTTLVGIVFEKRKGGDKSLETLEITGKLLTSFPDFYSMWNFRREILIDNYKDTLGLSCDTTKDKIKISEELGRVIRDAELKLSADCIQKNPKSYPAWHHRKWILERFDVDYEVEFSLCKEFLKLDQRNFHCWNYRRHVASISGIPDIATKECDFSQSKINENFSNYSAFHHRSVYIFNNNNNNNNNNNSSSSSSSMSIEELLKHEFDIVISAIFTEPDDQSAWWYHQFLLTNIHQSTDLAFASEILLKQLVEIENLVSIEPECKLARIAITSILEHFLRINKEGESAVEYRSKRRDLLISLSESDRMHSKRYQYLLSLPI